MKQPFACHRACSHLRDAKSIQPILYDLVSTCRLSGSFEGKLLSKHISLHLPSHLQPTPMCKPQRGNKSQSYRATAAASRQRRCLPLRTGWWPLPLRGPAEPAPLQVPRRLRCLWSRGRAGCGLMPTDDGCQTTGPVAALHHPGDGRTAVWYETTHSAAYTTNCVLQQKRDVAGGT